ncbi:MAG TPA: type III secretion fhipep protein [Chloroflexota bacterium]|nr:type III secretion fhipep protein [Chloroflexota bacterium]
MRPEATPLPPGEFCRLLLKALEASEGRRRRRKRDQTPDAIGLGLKRELLQRAIAANPAPAEFEGWLLAQALAAPASGPVRALCAEIFDEYRLAAVDPAFRGWLEQGAPSADAEEPAPRPEAESGWPRAAAGRTDAGS